MRNSLAQKITLSILMLSPASLSWAQGQPAGPRYEFGGGVVGSFYDKKTFTSTAGNADAGFDTGEKPASEQDHRDQEEFKRHIHASGSSS
jgi:hypothetical protein